MASTEVRVLSIGHTWQTAENHGALITSFHSCQGVAEARTKKETSAAQNNRMAGVNRIAVVLQRDRLHSQKDSLSM